MAKTSSFEEEFNAEVEKRIEEMENPDYEFPEKFSKTSLTAAIVLMVVCFVAIIVGTGL